MSTVYLLNNLHQKTIRAPNPFRSEPVRPSQRSMKSLLFQRFSCIQRHQGDNQEPLFLFPYFLLHKPFRIQPGSWSSRCSKRPGLPGAVQTQMLCLIIDPRLLQNIWPTHYHLRSHSWSSHCSKQQDLPGVE